MSGKLGMSSVESLETALMSPDVFHSETVTNSFKQILNFRLYYASVESSLFSKPCVALWSVISSRDLNDFTVMLGVEKMSSYSFVSVYF